MTIFKRKGDDEVAENAFGEPIVEGDVDEAVASGDIASLQQEAEQADAAQDDEEESVYAAYFYDADGVEQLIADDLTLSDAYIQGKELGDPSRGYKVVDPDGVVLYSHSH